MKGVAFVGDTLNDNKAAEAAGCVPHLVLTGKSEALRGQALPPMFPVGTHMHTDLNAFVDVFLKKSAEPVA